MLDGKRMKYSLTGCSQTILNHRSPHLKDYSIELVHKSFGVLVDYIENVKGNYVPRIPKGIDSNTFTATKTVDVPHIYEIAYNDANFLSKIVFKRRWRKLLAMAYIDHEIKELTGPEAPLEFIAYSEVITKIRDLYLWYSVDFKQLDLDLPTSASVIDGKMTDLLSIRQYLRYK